jgi:hypothetical protein
MQESYYVAIMMRLKEQKLEENSTWSAVDSKLNQV